MTVDAMDTGVPVPAAAASIVGAALRQYLDGGGNDITRNLGLRARRGGRHDTALASERRRSRNDLIVRIFDAQPGNKSEKAARVAEIMGGQAPASEVTDGELAAAIARLAKEFGADVPKSARQIMRLVAGVG